MAYTPNSLRCVSGNGLGGEMSVAPDVGVSHIWTYQTADAMTTVRGLNYFTDAFLRGMRAGDIVWVVVMAAGAPTTLHAAGVVACIAAGADLSDGTSITLTNT